MNRNMLFLDLFHILLYVFNIYVLYLFLLHLLIYFYIYLSHIIIISFQFFYQ